MTVRTRKADESDSRTVANLIRRSFQTVADEFGLMRENCPRHPSNCTEERIAADLERGVTYFLLEKAGEPVGCVAAEIPSPGLCYLERLSVLPEHRRLGFGKILVDRVVSMAGEHGARTISIGIIADQTELRDWYRRLGFVDGDTKEFGHLPFRVLFMSRDA